MGLSIWGQAKNICLGVYPEIGLKAAREKHEDLRRLLSQGIDPMEYKKEMQAQIYEEIHHSFEIVAREWFLKNRSVWTEKHAQTIISRLENNIFPWLGGKKHVP